MAASDRVLLGKITGPHGVRGQVKIASFTADPQNLTAYGALSDITGQRFFHIVLQGMAGGQLIARVDGVDDRNTADALRGTELYIARAALPDTEDGEYYHNDLLGLPVFDEKNEPFGIVKAIHNFGANDVLEITLAGNGSTEMFAFTQAVFPEVDLAKGRLTIHLPEVIEADDEQ